jgi:hypothetical protein
VLGSTTLGGTASGGCTVGADGGIYLGSQEYAI